MSPSEIAAHVGQPAFESVRSMLSKAWRRSNAPELIEDTTVGAAIEAEWRARKQAAAPANADSPAPALHFLPDPPASWGEAPAPTELGAFAYYDTFAEHARSAREKPHSAFVGLLPQVRIRLPAEPPADSLLAQTAIGTVLVQDHLLSSVAAVRDRMIQHYGEPRYADITRVDLISPARMGGRFGAIGLYLGYRNDAALPSFYLLEAGLATGPAVRLFPSPDMRKIVAAPTAYLPTPFVELSNTYDGKLVMNGDEPDTLLVESFREPRAGVGARIRVIVTYQPRTAATVTKLAPGDLTLLAAERIAAVGEALGEPAIELQGLLAMAGDNLTWIKKPA
jgi:hypothetical protein